MRKFLTTTKHITDCYECNLFDRTEEHTICQVNKQPIHGFPEPTNCPLPDVEKMDLSWKPISLDPDIQKAINENFVNILME